MARYADVFLALVIPVGLGVAATLSLRSTGWRARMPPVTMLGCLALLYHLKAPPPLLVAVAVAAWLVVLLASLRGARTLAVIAIAVCGAAVVSLLLCEALASA